MSHENAKSIWKKIQEAGDFLKDKLPPHPSHPQGRNSYAHVALEIKSHFGASYKDIEDLGEKNFYDLSKCLKELDIVVSSDTSIIHLCGLLNIKAYMLLNYNSDWRWFFDEEKTFWYPSIKIIKQKKINEWNFVFEKLEGELMNLYKNKFKA